MEDRRENSVFKVTASIIYKLNGLLDTSTGRALLANLRNSIGKPLSQTVEIWPLVFENLPDEFIGKGPKPTYEERAVITTLQLYALHQQGSRESVALNWNSEDYKKYFTNIGYSLNALRTGDSIEAIDRRFNSLITSDTFEELSHHLRQMIALLKAKTDVKVNYPLLAEDLYWFLRGSKERVRLNWARNYYRVNSKKNEDKGDK